MHPTDNHHLPERRAEQGSVVEQAGGNLKLSTFRLWALWLVCSFLLLCCGGAFGADDLVRGLVVDRSDRTLWLGLPRPVQRGAVFNVFLMPGTEPLARATVEEITPDPPYVARASVRLLRSDAFIPVGAYVEVTGDTLPATDEPGGLKEVDFHEETARRLSFRAGAFFPTDDDLSDETTDVWPTFQVAYRTGRRQGTVLEIGLAYYKSDGTFTEGMDAGSRVFSVLPLTIDARIPMSRRGSGAWFTRAGVGAYYIRDRRTVGAVTTSESNLTFGWQIGFGYASRRGHSAEIYYTDVAKTDFQGVVFSLGARF